MLKKLELKKYWGAYLFMIVLFGVIISMFVMSGITIADTVNNWDYICAEQERANNTTSLEKESNYQYAEIKTLNHNSHEICDLETGVHYFQNGGWQVIGTNQAEMSLVYDSNGQIKISKGEELENMRNRMKVETYLHKE